MARPVWFPIFFFNSVINYENVSALGNGQNYSKQGARAGKDGGLYHF